MHPNGNVQVLTGITIAALGGALLEKKVVSVEGSSTVLTLCIASACSNCGWMLPTHHPIYDFCWSKLLPMSLALLLLAPDDYNDVTGVISASPSETISNDEDSSRSTDKIEEFSSPHEHSLKLNDKVRALGVPFFFGSLGSILGCIVASGLATISYKRRATNGIFKLAAMPVTESAIAAGCIVSSYIGGSVNFFATANVLRLKYGMDSSSLLTSMAAADLLLMALYFAALTACHSSPKLHVLFSDGVACKAAAEINSKEDLSILKNATEFHLAQHTQNECAIIRKDKLFAFIMKSGTSLFCIILALGIVALSNKCEKAMPVLPGISCAFVALLSSGTRQILFRLKKRANKMIQKFVAATSKTSMALSSLCFSFLYASIGASANIEDALRHGSAAFLFALVALVVHAMVIGLSSFQYNRLVQFLGSRLNRFKIKSIQLEDILVASNSNIGESYEFEMFYLE